MSARGSTRNACQLLESRVEEENARLPNFLSCNCVEPWMVQMGNNFGLAYYRRINLPGRFCWPLKDTE